MEKAKLYCNAIVPKKFGKYRVSIRDIKGKEITGVIPISDNYLDVNVLEVQDERALVLFPKGLSRETAVVNSMNLY